MSPLQEEIGITCLLYRWQAAQLLPLLWSKSAQKAHGLLPLLHSHLLT